MRAAARLPIGRLGTRRPSRLSAPASAGLVLAAAALLAGCTSPSVVTRTDVTPTSSTSAAPEPTAQASSLAEQKKAAGIADCPTSASDAAPVAHGLPDLVLPCLGGGPDVRLAGLRGRPMIINVWAQWCQPCRQEAPAFTEVSNQANLPVAFLGIDFDDPRPELAIDYAKAADWHYPQLQDLDKALAGALQITAPPQTLFVDASGKIVHRHAGAITSAAELRDIAARHLGVTW